MYGLFLKTTRNTLPYGPLSPFRSSIIHPTWTSRTPHRYLFGKTFQKITIFKTLNKQPSSTTTEPPKRSNKIFGVELGEQEQQDQLPINKTLTARRLLQLAKPEAKYLVGGLMALGVSTATTLIFPAAMGRIMDLVNLPNGPEQLELMIFGLLGVFGIGSVAAFLRIVLMGIAAERMVLRLRQELFKSLMGQEISFFDHRKSGELINRLSADTQVMSKSFITNFAQGARRIAEGIGGLSILLYMTPKLTLTMLAIVPPVAIGGVLYGKFVRRLSTHVTDALSQTTSVASERFSSIRTVVMFSRQIHEIELYFQKIKRVFELSMRLILANGAFFAVLTFAINLSVILVLWHGSLLVIAGSMTTGELTSFLLYSLYVGFAFSGASNFYQEFMKALGSGQRVFELLDRIPQMHQMNGIKPETIYGSLEFKDVFFSYPSHSEQSVLKSFNLVLEPGQVLAVVGESGSGKSTIASLLLRFYDPNQGCILLDGKNLSEYDAIYLREKFISAVPQEVSLFSGTIAENIAYGLANASQEQIEEAAKLANAHVFIAQFKDGYNTMVGERGATLSGGQRQRIGIARALLKNPRILILDEATSALDVQSEYFVQQALERLMEDKGRTVLVIAHRLSTIKHADKIAMLRDGRIVEEGNFDNLMEKGGDFKNLVVKQLAD